MVIFTIVFCDYRVQIIQLYEISSILFRTMKGCLLVQATRNDASGARGWLCCKSCCYKFLPPLRHKGTGSVSYKQTVHL